MLDLACVIHDNTGCDYSGYPYSLHLTAVANTGKQYIHLIEDEMRLDVMLGIDTHDLMEDCRINFNDLKEMFFDITEDEPDFMNHELRFPDFVYNVTNELGRNRKEKAEKTYPKIAACKYSTFIKLCDRIANMKFSYYINDPKDMFKKYKSEFPDFYRALHNADHGFDPMWQELQALMTR